MSGDRIAVLGAGAWGTALAASFVRAGRGCMLWGRDTETVTAINENHRNPRYLGDIALPGDLAATTGPDAALAGAGVIVLAVPAQTLRAFLAGMLDRAAPDAVFVSTRQGHRPRDRPDHVGDHRRDRRARPLGRPLRPELRRRRRRRTADGGDRRRA